MALISPCTDPILNISCPVDSSTIVGELGDLGSSIAMLCAMTLSNSPSGDDYPGTRGADIASSPGHEASLWTCSWTSANDATYARIQEKGADEQRNEHHT